MIHIVAEIAELCFRFSRMLVPQVTTPCFIERSSDVQDSSSRRPRRRSGGNAIRSSPPHILRRCMHSSIRLGALVVGISREQAGAFAGVVPSTRACNAGYLSRVGVLKKHCGFGLQLRLMRALETRAKHNGWKCMVSDTTENVASANNFIRAGYRLYQPRAPWGWPNTLYWRKFIR
jgi:hypothetical protein